MDLPDYPPDWSDVSAGVHFSFIDGYRRGHRDGHLAGFDQGIRVASARDEALVRALADEVRRRDLEDEHMDTSGIRQWIKTLIEGLEAKARRDAFGQRVRHDREQRQTNWRAA